MRKTNAEGTRVYGASDDLIEFEGDFTGEVGCYGSGRVDKPGVLIVVSDGTILRVRYSNPKPGIWSVELERKGTLLDRIDQCVDEDADPYSDVAYFKEGVRWAYVATDWEKVN